MKPAVQHKAMRFAALVAGLLLAFCQSAQALTTVEHSFDEMVAMADTILVGTVTSIDSRWGEGYNAGTIYSLIQLEQLEVVKGEETQGPFTLKVIGGIVGDQAQFYPGMPQFQTGQRYLLFVRGNNRLIFPIVGVSQGIYRVQWDESQQQEIAIPSQADQHDHGRGAERGPQTLTGLIGEIHTRMEAR